MTQAQALVETARPLRLNEWEQAHLAALSHAVLGARAAAVAVLDRHLMRYPFDLLAHQWAALLDGFFRYRDNIRWSSFDAAWSRLRLPPVQHIIVIAHPGGDRSIRKSHQPAAP